MSEIEQPQTSDVLLLNLINTDNESTIEREQIDFGLPNTLAEPIEGSDANTRTEVIAVPDAPWNKSVKVDYHRRELARYFNGGIEVSVPKGATKEDIIARINAEYGTKLAHLEMEISPAITAENIPGEFSLKAVATSLGYLGQVPLLLDLVRSPLSDRLTKSDLEGFNYPNANTPSLNNIIATRNRTVDTAWGGGLISSGIQDNRKGFNTAENGEVVSFVRLFNTTGNWDTTGGVGVDPRPDGKYEITTRTGSHSNFGYVRPWQMALGFNLTAEQTKFQDILEGYDIEVGVTTANPNGSNQKVVKGLIAYFPDQPNRLVINNAAGGARIGTLANTGSGKTTTKTLTLNGSSVMFPGLAATTGSVNGTSITTYRGLIKVTLTLTRKLGKAKPIVITTEAQAV
ncbi:putative virion structural protein [Xanthomonas phage Xoo-sp14]|nr:putative virion structural protein [Xanthomonas phage Xoo-sp14]